MTNTARMLVGALTLVAVGALAGCSAPAAAHLTEAPLPADYQPLRYAVAGDAEFVNVVDAILTSSSSWGPDLVVPAGGGPIDFVIWLAEPAAALSRCGAAPGDSDYQKHHVSCSGGHTVVINSDRWFNGRDEPRIIAPVWRRLIINHEVGHQLGVAHGDVCNVMNPAVCPGEWPITPDDALRSMAREWMSARSTA